MAGAAPGGGSSFGIPHQCCRAPKHKDQHWEQRHCQGTSVSTWVSYGVLNIKMNRHRRPQSKIKPPPVHRNHSPTLCGHPELCGYSLRPWGLNHPLSKLVVSPAKMKTRVYCFSFGRTINIYVMHYQTKITMHFVPGIKFFSYWNEAVPRRDCS